MLGESLLAGAVTSGLSAGAAGVPARWMAGEPNGVGTFAADSASGIATFGMFRAGGFPLGKIGTDVHIAEIAVPQVTMNKAAGDAFEADVIANLLPKTQINIRPQITIKSGGPSSLKVRLDALGDDMVTGVTKLSDMKASDTAPLTANQIVVYPELELYGGIVVGKGKSPYVGGTNIPPATVDIIRK